MSDTFEHLAFEKKYVMQQWKSIVKRVQNGEINHSEVCASLDRIQRIDAMILEEAHYEANIAGNFERPQRFDFHSLLSPEFWDKAT